MSGLGSRDRGNGPVFQRLRDEDAHSPGGARGCARRRGRDPARKPQAPRVRRAAVSDDSAGGADRLGPGRPRGIKVYGATILSCEGSFYFNAHLEAARQKVNAWIRGSGRFDAVIGFDAAIRDPQRPARLAATSGGGDHLHPGPEGYKIIAGAVDLKLFGNRASQ
jgi:hypothetical protein